MVKKLTGNNPGMSSGHYEFPDKANPEVCFVDDSLQAIFYTSKLRPGTLSIIEF